MVFIPNLIHGVFGMIRSHYKMYFKSPEDILKQFEEVGFLYFVHCDGRMYCCDRMNDWAFADIEVADDTGNPSSAWMIVTPGFESLSDALDHPLFDGVPSASGSTTARSTWSDGAECGKVPVSTRRLRPERARGSRGAGAAAPGGCQARVARRASSGS